MESNTRFGHFLLKWILKLLQMRSMELISSLIKKTPGGAQIESSESSPRTTPMGLSIDKSVSEKLSIALAPSQNG